MSVSGRAAPLAKLAVAKLANVTGYWPGRTVIPDGWILASSRGRLWL